MKKKYIKPQAENIIVYPGNILLISGSGSGDAPSVHNGLSTGEQFSNGKRWGNALWSEDAK